MSCSLHDAARFEALGLPVAVIATDAFVRPADEQLAALNFGAYRPHLVFIPHPLASLSRPEVDQKADAALADVLRSLTGAISATASAPPLADVAAPASAAASAPRPANTIDRVHATPSSGVNGPPSLAARLPEAAHTHRAVDDEEACET